MKRLCWALGVAAAVWGLSLTAAELTPRYELKTSSLVTDILVDGVNLYAATYGGSVEVFDTVSKKRVALISLPMITDFMGEEAAPKVYAIDRIGDRLMMVSEGRSGYRNVDLYEGGKVRRIIGSDAQLLIKKGLFVDEDRILLGLLSSELILYRISTGEVLYRRAIKERRSGGSAFSDMALDEARATVATADESGEVNLFNVDDFTHLKLLKGQNVDNIYRIDYRKGTVVTAGQDRRCALYMPDGRAYYLEGSFLIYAAALSPSARTGVFAATIENDLQLFDTQTRQKGALLRGHGATLTDFAFISETEFFSAAEEKRILFWDLKQ